LTTERFVAQVVANNDDQFRGRIQVTCADLTGDPEAVLPVWVEPVFDWGWFAVPDVDEFVEVEVVTSTDDDESFGQSMIFEPQIHWRAKRFYHEGGETETPIHDDFKATDKYGKRRGFATPAGHILLFDDTDGEELVRLTWHKVENETDKYSYLALDKDGSVTIGNKKGSLIYLDAKNSAVSVIDEHGNMYASDSAGIRLIDKFSNIFEMKEGVVQLLSQDAIALTGKSCNVKTGSVDLIDGADNHLVRGEDLKTEYDNHVHPTGTGPSGKTLPLTAAVFSVNGKVK